MAGRNDHIAPLDELDDFQVAEGDPDVRGWDVLAADGKSIGKVDQLLVDTGAKKVRYLSVDLAADVRRAGGDRHILIPIGYAMLDETADRVRVDGLERTDIEGIPGYRREPITRDYEVTVVEAYDPEYDGRAEEIYTHTLYDDSRFYASRRR